MTGRRFEATISTTEAAVLGIAQRVPVRRFPLTLPSLSSDLTRLARIGGMVFNDLEARRLSHRGRLHRDLHRCFELFAEHTVSIGISGVDGTGADLFILGLTDHRDQLRITQHDDDLSLVLTDDDDDLPAMLVPLFDYGRPASDDPVMRMPLPDTAHGEHRASTNLDPPLGDRPIQSMVRPPERGFEHAVHRPSDTKIITAIPTFTRLGGGFIAIDGPNRAGVRVHAPPLSWIDTDVGRFLVTVDYERIDTGEIVYTPADAVILRRTLHQLAQTLWIKTK